MELTWQDSFLQVTRKLAGGGAAPLVLGVWGKSEDREVGEGENVGIWCPWAKTINLEVEGLSIRFRFLLGQLKGFLKKKKKSHLGLHFTCSSLHSSLQCESPSVAGFLPTFENNIHAGSRWFDGASVKEQLKWAAQDLSMIANAPYLVC